MSKGTTHVGMDVDARWIHVALLLPRRRVPVEWRVANELPAIGKLAKKVLKESPGGVQACYEAGPTGYALQRRFQEAGVPCTVIAPSLIPVKPGDRVKTDRRDARKLAELLRAGMLTEVRQPTEAEEAVRDLCRAREDAREDVTRCRHRLSKFFLRRGLRWTAGKRAWTHAHRLWLRGLRFKNAADQAVFDGYFVALEQNEERLKVLEGQLEEQSRREPYREPVGWLRCIRGIDTVTAMTLVAELHGFARFQHPRQLMSFLGLTPSEDSSAQRTRRGAITKAGNGHVRRVLVESAWHSRHRPGVSVGLRKRREGQPGWVIALADRAAQRLHGRYCRLRNKGKERNKVTVAVARELVGFVWAVLQHQRFENAA